MIGRSHPMAMPDRTPHRHRPRAARPVGGRLGGATRRTTFALVLVLALAHACTVMRGTAQDEAAAPGEPAVDLVELPRIPPTSPDDALSTMALRPGLRIELAACEPNVVDPIAIAFAADGALFAVEMIGYSERRDERLGRIRRLVDEDGDGRYERSSVFARDFAWPTGLACWDGGLYVIATPGIFYLKDHDGDGIADERREVWTGLGEGKPRLNVQALANSMTWGLDNRIHLSVAANGGLLRPAGATQAAPLAVNGFDVSFDPRTLDLRRENGGGQYGMCFDDHGNKFVCSNSHHLQAILYPARYNDDGGALPRPLVDIAADGPAAEVFRISPDEPWRIVRTRWRVEGLVPGPVEGGGRVSGYFTAACGLAVHRGTGLPEGFAGDAFVADTGSNLVHRKRIRWRDDQPEPVGERPDDERDREFLASSDNWFRPVQLANGPDGALYVVDMYREVVEHPWSLPATIKKHLDLDSGNDRGRIYRIVAEGFTRPDAAACRLDQRSAEELAALLAHPNGWHRDTAARLLYERQDTSAVAPLRALAREAAAPEGRLHAIAALAGLGALDAATLAPALGDSSPAVRRFAVVLAESSLPGGAAEVQPAIERLADDPSPQVRLQLALSTASGAIALSPEALARLVRSTARSSGGLLRAAAVRACGDSTPGLCLEVAGRLAAGGGEAGDRAILSSLIPVTVATARPSDLVALARSLGGIPDRAARFESAAALLAATRDRPDSSNAVPVSALRRLLAPVARAAIDALGGPEAEPDSGDDPDALLQAAALLRLATGQNAIDATGPLARLVSPSSSPELQQQAVESLAEIGSDAAFAALIDAWPRATPAVRVHLLQALLQREPGARALLGGIESGRLPRSALGPTDLSLLREHRAPDLAAKVEALLGDAAAGRPRAEALAEFRPALDLAGDALRGRGQFTARCATCHRASDIGTAVGPDVASFRSAGRETLLVNIIDPNREVAPQHTACLVETRSGETLLGSLAAEFATMVVVRLPLGLERSIPRDEILRMEMLERSLMPEGLESGMSLQDMADLLSFLAGD